MHVSVLCPPLLNRNTLSAHINALTREIEALQTDIEDQSLCNQQTGNNHDKFDKTLSTRGPLTSFFPPALSNIYHTVFAYFQGQE